MKQQIEASLVIPLYNNQKTLIQQLRNCENVLKKICSKYEIIVCDDKSTDLSAKILQDKFFKKQHFKIFFNQKNTGIAENVKKLYKLAKYSYIILFSVDGDWNPEDIGRLLKYAKKNKADMVIGKRFKKNYPLSRTIISFFYNFLPLLLFGVKTEDAGSIKVIKKELISNTKIISKSVFFEAEIIISAKKQGKKVLSLPVSFIRQTGKGSGGKFSLVIASFVDLIKLRSSI